MSFRRLCKKAKRLYYFLLGFIGDMLFILLRTLRIIPKISDFEEIEVKKILIIRLDRIGDVLLSTPTFRAVRAHFPKAQINLLVRSYTKDLVVGNPDINELIIFDDQRPFFLEILKKFKDLRRKNFDLAIVLHPSFWANFLAFISHAKYRVGYDAVGAGFLLTRRILDKRYEKSQHEVESTLDIVRSIGIEAEDMSLSLSIDEQAKGFAEDFLKKNNIAKDNILVAVSPGARYKHMRWKEAGFAKVSDYLIEEYAAKVMIIGSPNELALAEKVASLMKHSPIIIAGETRLAQLVALLNRCRLFIGNSSGPMHIASALGIPLVAIFGNINPADSYQSWGPWPKGQGVVSKNLNCSNCLPVDCASLDCMESITVADVLEIIKKQLAKK